MPSGADGNHDFSISRTGVDSEGGAVDRAGVGSGGYTTLVQDWDSRPSGPSGLCDATMGRT